MSKKLIQGCILSIANKTMMFELPQGAKFIAAVGQYAEIDLYYEFVSGAPPHSDRIEVCLVDMCGCCEVDFIYLDTVIVSVPGGKKLFHVYYRKL